MKLEDVAKQLENKYPIHSKHIQERLEDFNWQVLNYQDSRENEVTPVLSGGYIYADSGEVFKGSFLELKPIIMDAEQFEYNLTLELEELEAPFIEAQKIFDEDMLCKKLTSEPCGIYGD